MKSLKVLLSTVAVAIFAAVGNTYAALEVLPTDFATTGIDATEFNAFAAGAFLFLLGMFIWRKMVKSVNRS